MIKLDNILVAMSCQDCGATIDTETFMDYCPHCDCKYMETIYAFELEECSSCGKEFTEHSEVYTDGDGYFCSGSDYFCSDCVSENKSSRHEELYLLVYSILPVDKIRAIEESGRDVSHLYDKVTFSTYNTKSNGEEANVLNFNYGKLLRKVGIEAETIELNRDSMDVGVRYGCSLERHVAYVEVLELVGENGEHVRTGEIVNLQSERMETLEEFIENTRMLAVNLVEGYLLENKLYSSYEVYSVPGSSNVYVKDNESFDNLVIDFNYIAYKEGEDTYKYRIILSHSSTMTGEDGFRVLYGNDEYIIWEPLYEIVKNTLGGRK